MMITYKTASNVYQQQKIDWVLQLSSPLLEQPMQRTFASFHHKQIMPPPAPPLPVKLSKTPIKVNPLSILILFAGFILSSWY